MNRVYFLVLGSMILAQSCQNQLTLEKVEGKRIEINDSLTEEEAIKSYIAPFKAHIDSSLNAPLCYSPKVFSYRDGELNTAIGNMMADAIYELAGPVFKQQTDLDLDFVLLNHGGIRAVLPKGNVNSRNAYQIMPFENEVVVVGLNGAQLEGLVNYLQKAKRAHPVSKQFQLVLNSNYDIISTKIHGKIIDENKVYYIATNDFLYNGGDNMNFFKPNSYHKSLGYKVRNVLIDYFKKVDTLDIKRDNRFIRK